MLLMVKTKLIVVVMVLLKMVAEVNVSRDFSYTCITNGCNFVINIYNTVVCCCNVDICVSCSGCQ